MVSSKKVEKVRLKFEFLIFPLIPQNNWPKPPEESKTRCGDSFCINLIPIRANFTDFVICFDFFSNLFKKVKKKCNAMTHFPTFSQAPSRQAPLHPSQKMRLEISCNLDPVSSRLEQMRPHSCPVFVSNFDVFHKPLLPTSFALLEVTTGKMGNAIYLCFSRVPTSIPSFPWCLSREQGQKASRHLCKFWGM